LQNIFSKKVLKETSIHHLRLLHILGRLALFLFTPVWIFSDLSNILAHKTIVNLDYRVVALLFTDGALNWLQNILAFTVLSLVTPLTYAVSSASKRIFVIALSLFVLGNPVTWLNILGMTMAIIGVLCYNRAKYFQRVHKTSLPSYSDDKLYKTPLISNGKQNHFNLNGTNQNLLFSPNNMSTGSSMLVM
jgi:solute carrier family 35, member E1